MANHIARAREAIDRAEAATDDAAVRERIETIEEAIDRVAGIDERPGGPGVERDREPVDREDGDPLDDAREDPLTHPRGSDLDDRERETTRPSDGDALEEIESAIVGLMDEADGSAGEWLGTARDHLDAYRREHTRDW